jgi:alcohol dehydrogenase class IV
MNGQEVERREIVLPGIGQIVDLTDGQDSAVALATVRDLERQLKEIKSVLTDAIVDHARVLGTKTLRLNDGRVATLSAGTETIYDAERIETGLRALGMPEERIREVVVETLAYKVNAVEAKRVAGANPDYAKVIEDFSQTVHRPIYVSMR